MMGTKISPSIFHRMRQCIKGCMERRGYKLVAYLDDFLVVSETYEECLPEQHEIIILVRRFGFGISWSKAEGPVTKLTFLAVDVDAQEMTVGLPQSKAHNLLWLLRECSIKARIIKTTTKTSRKSKFCSSSD